MVKSVLCAGDTAVFAEDVRLTRSATTVDLNRLALEALTVVFGREI